MKTVLQDFSASFDTSITPLLEPVQTATTALAEAPDQLPARKLAPKLRELHDHIDSLVRKVAAQQAYVLIFGPLKSGKSTFMNALSSSYVSEVTSLPAYPCMVYVRYSDEPGFEVSQYDGRTMKLKQREALDEIIAAGHQKIMQRARTAEARGETFDPAVHMPDAIRKIDVKVSIDELGQSKAVLVDTPGLYTRMKFGYDRMTRDFRDSAACAIFVVKTDNLFLEQVFDEFGDLLELFSRIFLIVNVDSTKKDLLPDGTLGPSLEQRDPRAVIEVFEHLAMTSPLQKAVEEGRLAIYPIDLQRAASTRIRARLNDGREEAADDGNQADFGEMLGDLTEFLNSNEYLKAFIDDSLRRSWRLLYELDTVLKDEAATRLPGDVRAYDQAHQREQVKLETVRKLQGVRWEDRVQAIMPKLVAGATESAERIEATARDGIAAAVDRWFATGDSMQQLIDNELKPAFDTSYGRLIEDAEQMVRTNASQEVEQRAQADLIERDLVLVGIDLASTAASPLANLKHSAASPPQCDLPIDLPVRRRFFDWLLLRSQEKVRRRLFGPTESPSFDIAPERKQQLLGEEGKQAIFDAAVSKLGQILRDAAREIPEQLVHGFGEQLAANMQQQLSAALEKARDDVSAAERNLADVRDAQRSVEVVATQLPSFNTAVDRLVEQFGQDEPVAPLMRVNSGLEPPRR
jgi:GTPase SAR1 family protein